MGKKRSKQDRLYDLVRFVAVNPDTKQTRIMERCNFNHKSIKIYLGLAKKNDFILGINRFRITDQGMMFIEKYSVCRLI